MRCNFLVLAAATPSPHFVSRRRAGEVSRKATNFSPFLAAVQRGNDDEKAASMVSLPTLIPPPPQGWKKKASTETRLLLTGVEIFTHRCCGAGARCLPRLPSSISGNTRTEYFHMCGAFNKHSFPLEKVSSNKRPCCSNPLLARRGQKKFFSARRQLAAGEGGGFFLLASPPCLVLNK